MASIIAESYGIPYSAPKDPMENKRSEWVVGFDIDVYYVGGVYRNRKVVDFSPVCWKEYPKVSL